MEKFDNIHRGVYNRDIMNKDTMKRTQIYLPQGQLIAVKKIAQRRKITASGVIREILAEKLQDPLVIDRRKGHETLLEAAKRIQKIGKPGPRDLASRVDHYLYGKV